MRSADQDLQGFQGVFPPDQSPVTELTAGQLTAAIIPKIASAVSSTEFIIRSSSFGTLQCNLRASAVAIEKKDAVAALPSAATKPFRLRNGLPAQEQSRFDAHYHPPADKLAHRRVSARTIRVVDVLAAGKPREDRLAQKPGEVVPAVLADTRIGNKVRGHAGLAERVVQLPV